jgi:hypothetical protein
MTQRCLPREIDSPVPVRRACCEVGHKINDARTDGEYGEEEDLCHQVQEGTLRSKAFQECLHVLFGAATQGDPRPIGRQKGRRC